MAVHVPDSPGASLLQQPFVGRGLELARLRAFVQGAPHGAIAALQAPAGFGKTALLDELWRALPSMAYERLWIDARRHQAGDVRVLARAHVPPGPAVVILDGWERLAPKLADIVLPTTDRAHGRVVYVAAGREDPGLLPPHTSDHLDLGHLSPHEIDAWLIRYGLPRRERAALVTRTYGDPLAVALAIDVAQITGTVVVPVPGTPARLQLVDRLVAACAQSARRMALLALAVGSPVDAPGMRRALGQADVEPILRWLQRLTVVRSSPCGLTLQPFVAAHVLETASPADRLIADYTAARLGCPRPD